MSEMRYFSDHIYSKGVNPNLEFDYHISTTDYPLVHGHADFWDFSIITDGEVINYQNGSRQSFSVNDMFISTTDDVHCVKRGGHDKMRYININILESKIKTIADAFSPNFFEKLKKIKTSKIPNDLLYKLQTMLHRAALISVEEYQLFNDIMCSAFLLIMQHLFSESLGLVEQKPSWQNLLYEEMQKPEALSYSVEDLCANLNYSKTHLTRLFQRDFGISPHNYLTDYKMRFAENLLKNSDLKIIDIARQVGYVNLSQFNVNFKKQFNLSPSQYRKQHSVSKVGD